MKHFLIVGFGTHGDVLPLITIADRLQERGHSVTLVAPPIYRHIADEKSIKFIALSEPREYERAIEDMYLLGTRYSALFLSRHASRWNEIVFETVLRLLDRELTIVAADRAMLWADLSSYFQLNVRVVRVELEPPRIRSVSGQRREVPPGRVQARLLRDVDQEWRAITTKHGASVTFNDIVTLRKAGQKTVPRIGLYPHWLTAGLECNSGRNFGFIRAPEWDSESFELPFCKASNQKLLVFIAGTMGTTRSWSNQFFITASEICRELRCNGLFLGADESSYRYAWSSIAARNFLPVSEVLPFAHGLIHHGGIGTAAAAIGHGVPQIVIPRFARQYSNAEWLRRLGLCIVIDEKSYSAENGAKEVHRLLSCGCYRERALDLASRLNPIEAENRVCEFLETYSASAQDNAESTPESWTGIES